MRFGIEFALHRYETYGPVSWMNAFGQKIVLLAGPEALQTALVNKDKAFSQGGWRYFIDKFFHRGDLAPHFPYLILPDTVNGALRLAENWLELSGFRLDCG